MHQIVITDPTRLRAAIEFAQRQGCLEQFGVDLCRMLQVLTGGMIAKFNEDGTAEPAEGCIVAQINRDFAPWSFTFAIWHNAEGMRSGHVVATPSDAKCGLVGGWIYHGPTSPGDGSFPALNVSLAHVTGQAPKHSWSCHT